MIRRPPRSTLFPHDALPISIGLANDDVKVTRVNLVKIRIFAHHLSEDRSEEHTSELQSRQYLVCRLLLEKKKKNTPTEMFPTRTTKIDPSASTFSSRRTSSR